MRTWKARLALCLTIAGISVAASATQAPAAISDCPGQYICFWYHGDYNGDRQQYHDNGWQNLAPWFQNQLSSIYNNTNRYGEIAQGLGGTGARYCIPPGVANSFTGHPGWNDSAESIRLIAPPGMC